MTPMWSFSSLPRVVSGTIMLGLTLLISLEVLLRFALNLPLDWIVEVASILFVWMSMLGAAAAVPVGALMALRPLSNRVSPRSARALAIFVSLMTVCYGGFLLITGIQYVQSVSGQVLPVTDFPSGLQAAAFPVAGALFIVFALAPLCIRRTSGRNGLMHGVTPNHRFDNVPFQEPS